MTTNTHPPIPCPTCRASKYCTRSAQNPFSGLETVEDGLVACAACQTTMPTAAAERLSKRAQKKVQISAKSVFEMLSDSTSNGRLL